jgi:hypothetical protein
MATPISGELSKNALGAMGGLLGLRVPTGYV